MSRVICIAWLVAGAFLVQAKAPQPWKWAVVIFAKHEFHSGGNVVASESGQNSAREQFDLDAGDVEYTVEEWVVPQQMLRLPEGTRVVYSISGKDVTLKLPNGKTRKLKLVGTWPKSQHQQSR